MPNSLVIFPVGGGSSGGAVLSGVLSSGIVTSGFIGNNAVVSGSIASGSIAPPHIASGYKLVASGQVQGFFGTERDIASGTVGVFDFGSGAVVAGTVGSGAIVSGNIASGQIGPNHLSPSSVLSGAIGSGQVGQFQISSGAVTSGRLGVTGTPTGTLFLRDDFTWAAAGGGATGNASIGSIRTVSGSYIAASGDYTILSNVSGASGQITVPAAPFAFSGAINQGAIFNIKKIDPSPNAVTVRTASGESIDGAPSVGLTTQFQSLQIQSDGTSYWIL